MVKVKKGENGLLIGLIESSQPFNGYTEKEKSEGALLRNVFKKGDVYFNTSDLVRKMGFNHAAFVDRLGDTFRWKSENVSTTEVEGVICGHDEIDECVVYGVEIPNMVGRAGMVNLILPEGKESFDIPALQVYMFKELAGYSIPVFIRVSKSVPQTETMKHQKGSLKKEGYDCELTSDPIFFLDSNSNSYVPCTKEVRDKVNNGKYKL
jgi:citronellyl-CoA synthetase